jgi:putative Mg2+ transporter-C (MgtC) family protein
VIGEPIGQGWAQVGDVAIAFVLSALIGLERELKQKAAGLRTYTVVGVGAALFMLISKYGFTDVLASGRVVLDPSRVAAQVVSGLGFVGGGIIFVKRDSVRGLTTAASIWLTAAVGSAAGADLPILALAGVVAYFVVVLVLPWVSTLGARLVTGPSPIVSVQYLDGRGLLREVLERVTQSGFVLADLATRQVDLPDTVEVVLRLDGRGDLQSLVSVIAELDGVRSVVTDQHAEAY